MSNPFSLLSRSTPGRLVVITIVACALVFLVLELWRPCFFLTDDNLSGGLPFLTDMGRDIKSARLPFTSDYLFGGHYNYLRDLDTMQWHPFTMLPTLLADTPARFWIIDVLAFFQVIMTSVGFTLLACRLRDEAGVEIPDGYLVFYTLSFVFSTFVLTVGSSWISFLGNQSSLPWLALGLLERKITRATLIICLVTMHELLVGYPALTMTSVLFMTLFAIGVARWRRSGDPFFTWAAGNTLAISLMLPLLLTVLDGFVHSYRVLILPPEELTEFSIPWDTFIFSFFAGNWSEAVARATGDRLLATVNFPYQSCVLACAAAWCLLPALLNPVRWRGIEKVCVLLGALLFVWIMRPQWMADLFSHLPFFRSLRWPFREGLLFLFFIHVLLILRFPARLPRFQAAFAVAGLLIFLLPLPFIRVPSLNTLAFDRQLLFSGKADRFWALMKTQLKPGDMIATAVDPDYFRANVDYIPYTLLGTADFPAFFKVTCVSGYSPTAPLDQMPVKTYARMWFGAYSFEQVPKLLAEKPDVKLLRLRHARPLKITLSDGAGPEIDLTPLMRAAGITETDGPATPVVR